MLEDIADFIQVKYISNVVRMIRDVERPTFTYPTRPILENHHTEKDNNHARESE